MELVPFYGEQPLAGSNVTVRVRASDRQFIKELIARTTKEVTVVNSEETYTQARRAAAQLKAVSKEVYQAKRAAKTPFEAVTTAIEDLAKELGTPVDKEEERIINLMTGYVRELERKQKQLLKEQQKKLEEQERAHQEKIRQMEEKERAQAQLLHELEMEVQAMNAEPLKGVVPGGRITHPFKFRLIDAAETVKAGALRLLRIELDILSCQDSVRSQLEIAPDREPTLPGIEITRETSISIKASSRIS